MPRTFQITIDIHRLREHLSTQDGRPLSENEVLEWLRDAGFRRIDNCWQVQEQDLGQLEPDEVSSVTIVEDPDTIPSP